MMKSTNLGLMYVYRNTATHLTVAFVALSEFIAGPTADLSHAAERALRVDATLTSLTVAGSQETLIDI